MTYRASRFRVGMLLPAIYLLVGAFVAASHNYYDHTSKLDGVVNAVLAIVLWPLVLIGVHMNV